jgi:hypothetical protein
VTILLILDKHHDRYLDRDYGRYRDRNHDCDQRRVTYNLLKYWSYRKAPLFSEAHGHGHGHG